MKAAPCWGYEAGLFVVKNSADFDIYSKDFQMNDFQEVSALYRLTRFAAFDVFLERAGAPQPEYVDVVDNSVKVPRLAYACRLFTQAEAEINGERLMAERKQLPIIYIFGEELSPEKALSRLAHNVHSDIRYTLEAARKGPRSGSCTYVILNGTLNPFFCYGQSVQSMRSTWHASRPADQLEILPTRPDRIYWPENFSELVTT